MTDTQSTSESEHRSVKTLVPQHSVKIRYKKRQLIVRVTLHKIPEQTIKFEPTATHFYLDTLRYTKKYLLHFQYPQGIKVDPENCEAVLEYGILTATFPITEIIDKFTGEVVNVTTTTSPQSKKRKEREEESASSSETSIQQQRQSKKQKTVTQNENLKLEKKTNSKNTTSSQKSNTQQQQRQHNQQQQKQKQKQHDQQQTTSESVKNTQTNGFQSSFTNNSKKVKPTTITDDPMKSDKIFELVESIARVEDEKREKKLQKIQEKEAYFEKQQQKRMERKLKKQLLRQQALEKIMANKHNEQNEKETTTQKEKKSKRRVSFSDEVTIIDNQTTQTTNKIKSETRANKFKKSK